MNAIHLLLQFDFVSVFILMATATVRSDICPDVDGCILKKYGSSSEENPAQNYLICRSFIDMDRSVDVQALYICKYDNTTFYLSNVVNKFPSIRYLHIVDSTFSYLIGTNRPNNITHMRISNTTLLRVADNLLTNLRHLHVLDLRNNLLDQLPNNFVQRNLHPEIYLSKNDWNCSVENILWAANINTSLINDKDLVNCFDGVFNGKPLFRIVNFQKAMLTQCPSNCECRLLNVVRNVDSNYLNPIISANCSNRNLFELPTILPNLTKILHVEYNQISDLSPVISNPSYKDLQELYLDHNCVKSIAVLEGGQWLEKLSLLSLRYNNLIQLPWYALDNALKRNPNMPNAVLFYLSDNPWRCDCAYTPHFQDMLMKYEEQIRDISAIRCRNVSGDKNSNLPILSLDRSGMCRDPNEFSVKPLDLVNIILASLIIIVLGKLAYDYYFFKKTGRLPWIVSKMP